MGSTGHIAQGGTVYELVIHIQIDETRPDSIRATVCRAAQSSEHPVCEDLDAWKSSLMADGRTAKHVDLFTTRARRIVALVAGAPLSEIEPATNATRARCALAGLTLSRWVQSAKRSDLTVENVQTALAALRNEGRSLRTCNHHRTAIRGFSKWCFDTGRTRDHWLRGVKGYNADLDPRHQRRTISLEELRMVVAAAESGTTVLGVSGRTRAILYRLAVATGLRYSELGSLTPSSFNWGASSVAVEASETKNRRSASLALGAALVLDLRRFCADLGPDSRLFVLPPKKGAVLLRADLAAAAIPYETVSGFFDFHSLRCETATLADAAGVSPRVVQRLMRHSTLELTDRYTRPRDSDVRDAAMKLPDLGPDLK